MRLVQNLNKVWNYSIVDSILIYPRLYESKIYLIKNSIDYHLRVQDKSNEFSSFFSNASNTFFLLVLSYSFSSYNEYVGFIFPTLNLTDKNLLNYLKITKFFVSQLSYKT